MSYAIDDPNAFLGLFYALPSVFSLNLRAFSFQFHKNFDSNFRAFLLHFGQYNSLLSRLQYLIYSFVPNTMAFCSVFIVSFVSISYSVFFRRKSIFRGAQGGVQGQLCFRPDLRNRALRTAIWMFWIKIRTNVVIQTKDAIFFKKTLFSQKNAVFYEEKLFFALFFEKRAIFRKKSRPEKSRRKLKSTSDLVRSREFKRLFRPILCAPKCIFLESQSIFIPISQKF